MIFFYIYTSDGETWTLSFVIDAKEGDFHTLWERVWSLDWIIIQSYSNLFLNIYYISHCVVTWR
jgi:hypothetical protein